MLVDAGLTVARRDVVVAHRHRRVGPAHLPSGEAQTLEGLRRRHLMDQVEVDIDEERALALRGDDVTVPDLVEQGTRLGHAWCSSGLKYADPMVGFAIHPTGFRRMG